MKSREEQLTWAKQRALICVDTGAFACAVAALRVDLAANPLTKGVISSEQAMRGYKAAADAALGRGSQALTELPVTHCTGPSTRRLPEGAGEAREPVQSGRARVASKLARPQQFFNHLRMLTATSR